MLESLSSEKFVIGKLIYSRLHIKLAVEQKQGPSLGTALCYTQEGGHGPRSTCCWSVSRLATEVQGTFCKLLLIRELHSVTV